MKRPSFDAATLRLLEELYESTWVILEAQHPFRDTTKDNDRRHQLRRKLFILAENSDLTNLDALQKLALDAFVRDIDY
jgi:hypothetical protein